MTPPASAPSVFARHGGRLSAAEAAYPGAPRPWVDLSTGINPHPYPAPRVSRAELGRLPDPQRLKAMEAAAAAAFGAPAHHVAAVPGSEAAIRLLPRLTGARSVAIAQHTYGGHAEAWRLAGVPILGPEAGAGAEAWVVVNPNNPDGRVTAPRVLIDAARDGRWVIADEAFADLEPGLSVAAHAGGRLIVLRSFGKFYGLAGLRLGFVIAGPDVIAQVRAAFGDWPVTTPAIAVGLAAYGDSAWATRTRLRLARSAARLDGLLTRAGLTVIGGTSLFRLARTARAPALFDGLAKAGLLCRPFDDAPDHLRFGLPGRAQDWARLQAALACGDDHVR